MFHVNYLGGDMPTFALNFSRPGAQVVLQYFQFLRLGTGGLPPGAADLSGRGGARRADAVGHAGVRRGRPTGRELPVVTFSVSPSVKKYSAYDVSRKLREHGWLVPAYTMPPKREDLVVLRVVVRNGFSHDMAELFLRDLRSSIEWLDHLESPMPVEERPSGFHH